MTDLSPDQKIARGHAAKRLMEDPLWAEAFADIEKQLFDKFKGPGLAEDDMMRLWLSAQMLGRIKSWFEARIGDGKVTAFNLKQEKAPS